MWKYLYHGICERHKRRYYAQDSVFARDVEHKGSLRFHGIVYKLYEDHNNNRERYLIDDVVEVDTVSDKLRDECIEELDKGAKVSNMCLWGSGVMTAGGIIIGVGTSFVTCGWVTGIIGFLGMIFGGYRENQFNDEIKRWRKTIDDHANKRFNINNGGHRYIFNNKYIGVYCTPYEASHVWKNDTKTLAKQFLTAIGSSHKTVVSTVQSYASYHPLQNDIVQYFLLSSDSNYDNILKLTEEANGVTNVYGKHTDEFNEQVKWIKRARTGDVMQIDSKYDSDQSGVQALRSVDSAVTHMFDNGPRNSFDRVVRTMNNSFKDYAYTSASASIERSRATETIAKHREYDEHINEKRIAYELKIAGLLPNICDIYDRFLKLPKLFKESSGSLVQR